MKKLDGWVVLGALLVLVGWPMLFLLGRALARLIGGTH